MNALSELAADHPPPAEAPGAMAWLYRSEAFAEDLERAPLPWRAGAAHGNGPGSAHEREGLPSA